VSDTSSPEEAEIKRGLQRSDKGVPFPNHSNVVYVLQRDPMYTPERLWYDEFHDRVFLANSPMRMWSDADDTQTAVDMQARFGVRSVGLGTVASAVHYVAHQRTRHCVRDWLETLTWDGTPRIETAFEDYWGAQGTLYTKAASRNFFIGLAARIFKPGCKLDTMPVFEGAQGIKKSTALGVLGGEWTLTANRSVESIEFFKALRGKWIVEIGEMQSFSRPYRPSFGRHTVDYARQSVFCGTVNGDEWADDDSGLRRFWPIVCGEVNIDALRAAREQLFAEAVAQFKAGASWWEMPTEETLSIQADRQQQDVWTQTILEWLDTQFLPDGVSIRDILTGACKVMPERQDRFAQLRVGRVLRLNGWNKNKVRVGQMTLWKWSK
jgi:predicted P-loop ATPase